MNSTKGEFMKEIIKTADAPGAVGPYSQAVKVDCKTMIFCSGQIPLDPKNGKIVGKTTAEQAHQVLKNLGAVLKASGADFKNVVKTTVYLADINDFAAVNEVYSEYFLTDMPARAAFQVGKLPKDALIEIEAIAVV
jgi:2-iminobutanoate/2-iminopropanoate deaminase